MEQRINQLIESLQKNDLESIFITSKANVFYFSNLYAEAHERLIALYIDVKGRKTIIAPALELEDIKNAGWTSEIITYFDHENPWKKFEKWLSHSGGLPSNLAIEEENLNVERFQQLQNLTKNEDIQYGQRLLNELRVIKEDDEVEILQEAARFADFGIETAVKHIKPGKTELEIIAEVEYALKEKGIRHMSFSTLVLSGAKTAAPHGTPSTKPIEDGNFVLMDLGVVYKGYCSDITRTVAVGEINEEQEKVYNTVLAAQQNALDVCEINTPLGQIDRAARSVIEDAGYGEYFTHRIGHGIGIDVHEFPSMASNNEDPLKPGMSFTIEPGIYVPGVGGVRIEDDVLMTENGPKTLTQYPKTLQRV
ncbi:M24 family metallopeptidase [Alkalibacillus haloalkaliphilus]|uniref:M24 family metallopeptidase n=1 Tax=Alkalibacillus haloalkaliphilus TaxID=94136 RepID=UPI00293611B1|nr:Xaa-Pro peptidase family protein [Alkalibacillus haloalkaliphilus]MDV2581217.1 Xaa-Pro peptidase family protein [Alkalibacillus haloalkaliphilus]